MESQIAHQSSAQNTRRLPSLALAMLVAAALLSACSGQKVTPITRPDAGGADGTGGMSSGADTRPSGTRIGDPGPTDIETETLGDLEIERDPREAGPEVSIDELQQQLERQGLLGDIFFEFDRYDLQTEARQRLASNAEYMNGEGRDLVFVVEGHCDERGTNEYNIALGQQRADTTIDYLVNLGVDRSRFRTVSFGEERPFCVENHEGCWRLNRRARFVISGSRGY